MYSYVLVVPFCILPFSFPPFFIPLSFSTFILTSFVALAVGWRGVSGRRYRLHCVSCP